MDDVLITSYDDNNIINKLINEEEIIKINIRYLRKDIRISSRKRSWWYGRKERRKEIK